MKIEIQNINDNQHTVLIADEGKTFIRVHDEFVIGENVVLGYDYSTGVKREDKLEYYREVDLVLEEKND